MKTMFSLLDEALVLHFRAVRRHFWKLFGLFLPVNLLTACLHCRTAQRFDAVPFAAIKPEMDLEQLNALAVSVLAALLVVRTVWRLAARPTDENALGSKTWPRPRCRNPSRTARSRAFGRPDLLYCLP